MKMFSVMALALMASVSVANASELDNDVSNAQRFAAELPQTVVVKKDAAGQVSVMHSASLLEAAPAALPDANFVTVGEKDRVKGELDGDSSSSGWYFYWNYYNYSYPSYYYYNYTYSYSYQYTYQPYYNYYYNNCYYTYYRWY